MCTRACVRVCMCVCLFEYLLVQESNFCYMFAYTVYLLQLQPYIESLESCRVEVVLVCPVCPSIVHQLQFPAFSLSVLQLLRFSFLLLGTYPEDQVKSKQEPLQNDSRTKKCCTRHACVCALVVISLVFIGLCLLGGGIIWFYSSLAPGQSAWYQGKGKVSVLC